MFHSPFDRHSLEVFGGKGGARTEVAREEWTLNVIELADYGLF
jgi:hypothetical protein